MSLLINRDLSQPINPPPPSKEVKSDLKTCYISVSVINIFIMQEEVVQKQKTALQQDL